MPEISICFFDLRYFMKLFPQMKEEVTSELNNFENSMEAEMAKNRTKLFAECGYEGEFQNI